MKRFPIRSGFNSPAGYGPAFESPEPARPVTTYYSFRFPRQSVEVHFSVVSVLESQVAEGVGQQWGLLIGHRTPAGDCVVIEAVEPAPASSPFGDFDVVARWQPVSERRVYAIGYFNYSRASRDREDAVGRRELEFVQSSFAGSAVALHLRRQNERVVGKLWNIAGDAPAAGRDFALAVVGGRDVTPMPSMPPPMAPPPTQLERMAWAEPVSEPVSAEQAKSRLRAWVWPSIAAVAVAVGIGALALRRTPPEPAAPVVSRAGKLELNLEPVGSDVKLTWKPDGGVFASAHGAVLWISEDGESKSLALDKTKLDTGTLLYTPSGSNLAFRLEVFGDTGSTAETVKLFRTETPTSAGMARVAPAKQPAPAPAPPAIAKQAAQAERRENKPFVPPKKAAPAGPELVSGVPAPVLRQGAAQASMPTVLQSSTPRIATPEAPAQVAPKEPVRQSSLNPPKPVYKEQPRFTSYQLSHAPVGLAVDVDLDDAGRVTRAVVIPGQEADPTVLASTLKAARLWRFTPAQLNGKPISSKVTIHFVFRK